MYKLSRRGLGRFTITISHSKIESIAYSLLYRVRNNNKKIDSTLSGSIDLGHAHFYSVS